MISRRQLKKRLINSISFPLLKKKIERSTKSRIVHIKNGGIGPGGANNYMFEIIEYLVEYEQFVWYEKGRTYGFRNDVRAYSGNLEEFLRIVQPKIVQIHYGGGGKDCLYKVRDMSKQLGYKVIFTFHKLSEPFLLDGIDCNLFVNDFYTKLPQYCHLSNIGVISGGVNERTYQYEKKPPESPFTVGRISRVDDEKVDSILSEILKTFSKRKDVGFYFIGGTKRKIQQLLIPRIPESMMHRTKIDRRVVKTLDKIDKMKRLDVFIHFTSKDCNAGMGENFSLALIEAMMIGIPIVTENKGGIRNQIRHGYNGFLCDSQYDYYKYTIRLLDNQDIWKEISLNARNHAEKYFSSSIMAQKTRKLYEGLLNVTG